ncbi:hypothetical protein GH741_18680 [Aquibacillus halophilus]|uniref:DUF5067 domain-containing protein n=1 Tax=Aquibacillus halophilus TaxID=930132 RepID=A0A6A8DJL6_9BACI|nr:hypothetical protein [Aquibacillus halophilus]MRH44676.1 hypothetical protein [Aquibacillus halophilus]
MHKIRVLIVIITFLLIGCQSETYPKEYQFSDTQVRENIEITLLKVEEFQQQRYNMTTFNFLVLNNSSGNAKIVVEPGIKMEGELQNSNYLQDKKGNAYSINGSGQELYEWEEIKEEPGGETISLPSGYDSKEMNISYDALDIEEFETQVVVELSSGKMVPFIFSGTLEDEKMESE